MADFTQALSENVGSAPNVGKQPGLCLSEMIEPITDKSLFKNVDFGVKCVTTFGSADDNPPRKSGIESIRDLVNIR